ncbi:hypothetical protein DM02DRAFT_701826 [Periconia macrospinosa]|uniref:BTB domain-containing protein n=1 Tax=Periconia macrospinosa TaxID=97972 RepID=A0A2V1D333_9PLEO|nr:hypothetical protein DM02DRAFT_701826 [Periconia macrospinosa]
MPFASSIEAPPDPNTIILDIGGRKFKTLLSTLRSESGYFEALFSERWDHKPDAEESYFIDADPEIFEHLLRYMRRPWIFPIFWSKQSGFDYSMYRRLGHEAQFFQIHALSSWIEDQRYINGISISIDAPTRQTIHLVTPEVTKGNEEISHHFHVNKRRVYLCPRAIVVHRGHPELCGAACPQGPGWYQDGI